MNELTPEICVWPTCGCKGACKATGGERRMFTVESKPTAPSGRGLLMSAESKLDALTVSCAALAVTLGRKADTVRVEVLEADLLGVHSQLWAIWALACLLAVAQAAGFYWLVRH